MFLEGILDTFSLLSHVADCNQCMNLKLPQFYSDPASRLVFCSKLEVLRYVETGEVSRHAFRRRNGSVVGEGFAIGKTAVSLFDTAEIISTSIC